MTTDQINQAVDAIIRDLCGRRGLSQQWDQIDPEIVREIRETWIGILAQTEGGWGCLKAGSGAGAQRRAVCRSGWLGLSLRPFCRGTRHLT